MKSSKYLVYNGTRHAFGGEQKIYRFQNNYGASVIKGPDTYGYEKGLWELGVIKFYGKNDDAYHLVYDTSIASDVIGYLNEEQVEILLQKIYKLAESLDSILGLKKED